MACPEAEVIQKTVEVPQIEYVDNVVEAGPAASSHQAASRGPSHKSGWPGVARSVQELGPRQDMASGHYQEAFHHLARQVQLSPPAGLWRLPCGMPNSS